MVELENIIVRLEISNDILAEAPGESEGVVPAVSEEDFIGCSARDRVIANGARDNVGRGRSGAGNHAVAIEILVEAGFQRFPRRAAAGYDADRI